MLAVDSLFFLLVCLLIDVKVNQFRTVLIWGRLISVVGEGYFVWCGTRPLSRYFLTTSAVLMIAPSHTCPH